MTPRENLDTSLFFERLRAKDPTLWTEDKTRYKAVRNSLGWLDLPQTMAAGLGTIRSFAAEVRAEGFTATVILGDAPPSLRPGLEVLDSANPADIIALQERLDPARTFFIAASRAGFALETDCLARHFLDLLAIKGLPAAKRFAAVTDPGTSLEKKARRGGFRKVFLNPPDLPEAFSALSYSGLVPAALAGLDVDGILSGARDAAREPGSLPSGSDENALGRRLFQGQVETAAASFLRKENPFDRSLLRKTQGKTEELLAGVVKGKLPPEDPPLRAGGLAAFCDEGLSKALGARPGLDLPLRDVLAAHLRRLGKGESCLLRSFVSRQEPDAGLIARLRELLETTGSPRARLMLVAQEARDIPVPGERYTFGTLHKARARSEFAAALEDGSLILRLDLGPAGAHSLKACLNSIGETTCQK